MDTNNIMPYTQTQYHFGTHLQTDLIQDHTPYWKACSWRDERQPCKADREEKDADYLPTSTK